MQVIVWWVGPFLVRASWGGQLGRYSQGTTAFQQEGCGTVPNEREWEVAEDLAASLNNETIQKS